MTPREKLLQILELARWAPSGDNTQPWRFQIIADDLVIVHAFDTRDYCVYDLDGHASQLSVGAMLETLRVAAASFGLVAGMRRRPGSSDLRPEFEVRLGADSSADRSPLAAAIKTRCVQRRPMSTRRLAHEEKAALGATLPEGYDLLWLEGWSARWRVARVLLRSAKIRLTIPEAFETHRRVIEWDAQWSEDKIPDQAIGLDPLTRKLMRWVMEDWRRAELLNGYLGGTIVPRLQLDLLPGMACAAHVVITAGGTPAGIDDFAAAGAAVQRFWLQLTALGLYHQPEMTPLIFARYAREGRGFSKASRASDAAREVLQMMERLVGVERLPRAVWMGRIGAGPPPRSRSHRLPLEKLIL
jgi:nitroreductase